MKPYLLAPLVIAILCSMILATTGPTAEARQFRLLQPIASESTTGQSLPANAQPVEPLRPLTRAEVEPLVRKLLGNWNSPAMADFLADGFYDKNRLLDVMDTSVPRDAKLSIQSIQGIQTLRQYRLSNSQGRDSLVSVVSATVNTQLEFNGSGGFVRLPGTNELILEITTAAAP